MSDIGKLAKMAVDFRDARDWKQFHNPKDMAIGLIQEAFELLDHFKWLNSEEVLQHLSEHRAQVAEELADILYWTVLMAHDFDIDLRQAFYAKMEKNAAKYPVEKARGRHLKYDKL